MGTARTGEEAPLDELSVPSGLWRRGYVIADASAWVVDELHQHEGLSRWESVIVGRSVVLHDPDLPCKVVEGRRGASVAILGIVFDAYTGERSSKVIARRVLAALKRHGSLEDRIADATETLSGRFVIAFQVGGDRGVVGDATAMRTIAHGSIERAIVSSHPGLVAELIGSQVSDDSVRILGDPRYGRDNVRMLPGAESAYEGVWILPPNFLLDLNDGSWRRFAPRSVRVTRRLDEVVEEMEHVFRVSASVFNSLGRPLLSLTAGLDSRVSAAAADAVGESWETFTYVDSSAPHPVHERDVAVARTLARRLGLEHTVVDLASARTDPVALNEVSFLVRRHSGAPPHTALHTAAMQQLGWHDRIHVRSNLSEIGRYYWKQRDRLDLDPAVLASKWSYAEISADGPAIDRFAAWIRYTSFDDVTSHGFDYYDWFYWEHRMPMWHSALLTESDLLHETVSLFNCRRLLMALLGLPPVDRKQASAYLETCERLGSNTLSLPINSTIFFDDAQHFEPVALPDSNLRLGKWNVNATTTIDPDAPGATISAERVDAGAGSYGGFRFDVPLGTKTMFLDLGIEQDESVHEIYVSFEDESGRRAGLAIHRATAWQSGTRRRDYVSMSASSLAWVPSRFEVDPSAGPAASAEIFARLRSGMTCRLVVWHVETSPEEGRLGP